MNNKTCSKCKQSKPVEKFHKSKRTKDGLSGYCKKCQMNFHSSHRQTTKGKQKVAQYKRKYNYKVNAHNRVKYAIKIGNLEKLPCQICGNVKSEAHHRDYTKPLEVVFLCRKHHRAWHRVFELEGEISGENTNISADKGSMQAKR